MEPKDFIQGAENFTQRERLRLLLERPALIDEICFFISSGAALTAVCRAWNVRYGAIYSWIKADPERLEKFQIATSARDEWAKERVLEEVRALGLVDIRKAFNPETGALLPMHKIPDDVAAAIQAVEVEEISGIPGFTKKVRFWNKLDALRELGTELGMFVKKVDVKGKLTLEDLVAGSNPPKQALPAPSDPPVVQPPPPVPPPPVTNGPA